MKRILLLLSCLQLAILIGLGLYFYSSQTKVAYVRSAHLIENFVGTQQAKIELQKDIAQYQSNLDTLKAEYASKVKEYQANKGLESALLLKQLEGKESGITTYSRAAEERIQQQENELLEGVMNQINSYIQIYAEEKGFDIILGTTAAGSILFGEDEMDVTESVLTEMNKYYGE